MAVYPLLSLVKLREQRQDRALQYKARCLQLAAAAAAAQKQAQQALEEYRQWREQEIQRRYASIIDTRQSISSLQRFNEGISSLGVRELELMQQLQQKEKEAAQARQKLQEATDAARQAGKALQKLLRHQEIWQAKEKAYEEYKSELELEDFKAPGPQEIG